MATRRDLKRTILITRWLPDNPGIFRQEGVAFALKQEGIETTRWMVYDVVKSLWDTGYLERSIEQTSYVHTGGILRTHWYRFARLDRESTKPGWRAGEQYHAQLWKGSKLLTPPRQAVPEAHERSVPTSRQVKGLPKPDDLTWATWEDGPQTKKAVVNLYLGFELREQAEEIANLLGITKQAYIRSAIEEDLRRRKS